MRPPRSRLNWLILKTAAFGPRVSAVAAFAAEVARRAGVPPGSVRASVYRLAGRGRVRRRGGRLEATARGRRELAALDRYWGARGASWEPPPREPAVRTRGGAARWRAPAARRGRGFVGYAVPRGRDALRRAVLRRIRRAGYVGLHPGFYVGPAVRLRGLVEELEALEGLAALRWGTLTVLSR